MKLLSTPQPTITTTSPPNSQQVTPASSQEAAASLVKGAGHRNLTLNRYSDGKVEVVVSPPPPTQLVLSGGGAKGVAFSGAIKALEDKNALAGVRVISGSSAGAISAVLIASGLNAKDFDTLSDGISLPDLLNSKSKPLEFVQKAGSTIGGVFGKVPGVGNFSQLLCNMLPRLQSKAEPLEELMRNESRKSVLKCISQSSSDTRPLSIMAIADKLNAGGATTFADLNVLSQFIPEIKQLNVTGVAMFNDRPQLVVFNANLTPDMDIARAAHISGSLPIVFSSPEEQGLGFQKSTETTHFKDGGLFLNTPVSELYQRQFPESALDTSEKLILKFEPSSTNEPAIRGGVGSSLVDRITGVPHTAAHSLQENKLQAFTNQTVTLPLKTDKGDFSGTLGGTINFTMPHPIKNYLQELTQKAVSTHLENRAQVREHHQFDSIDEAVLAMDDDLFGSVAQELEKDSASSDVLRFRQCAQQALKSLDAAITEANTAPTLKLTPQLGAALRNLDALANRPEHVEWLSKKLNTSDNYNFQQLLQAMNKEPTQNSRGTQVSRVMTNALTEMKKRDIAVIADNFTREVIYPSRFRPGQPKANIDLLQRAEHNLAKATTATEVNKVLDDIANNYVSRNTPWTRQLHSTTVEMAKAWRLPG